MAQYNYDQYAAKQAARKASAERHSNGNFAGNSPEVHFLNEYLKNDGDVAVVRFPYKSMSDISFETTHTVTFPGKKFPSRVRCDGDGCTLCAEHVKLDVRFFAKALAYIFDESAGCVKAVNTVWDRPSAFADIDIKNLIQEYGDLTQSLFKIKRNGTGTNTRYTINVITNTAVYKPEIYKADFSELDLVDASKILSKSMQSYKDAVNPVPKADVQETVNTPDTQIYSTNNSYQQNQIQENKIQSQPNSNYKDVSEILDESGFALNKNSYDANQPQPVMNNMMGSKIKINF